MAPRRQHFNRIVHTCHFTPHQLQSSEILRWAMDSMVVGFNDQLGSFRLAIKEHRWSVVIVGFEIVWVRPFLFFDASSIDIDTGMLLHDGKRQVFGYTMRLSANGEDVVRIASQTHPVQLSGGDAMDALAVRGAGALSGLGYKTTRSRMNRRRALPVQNREPGQR